MATVDDIVKLSGVSRSTVFRFLNGTNVRMEAKKCIIQAMEELNYKTDLIYKQQNIVIEISTSNNFESFKGFTEMVQGITQRADEKGVQIHIVRRTGEQIERDYERWNDGEDLKGVIIIGKNIKDEQKEAEMLRKKNIPHIFLNRVMAEEDISYVAVDAKKAAYEIVDFLIKNGCKTIGTCGNPTHFKIDRDKLDGYIMAFQENGMEVSKEFYREVESQQERDEWAKQLIQQKTIPDAYFAICDSHALKFIHLTEANGLRVPDDIGVVGMDDVEFAEYFKPALTTIHVPFQKMGIVAVDNLLQLIMDNDISCMKSIVKHKLVIRDSCQKQLTVGS